MNGNDKAETAEIAAKGDVGVIKLIQWVTCIYGGILILLAAVLVLEAVWTSSSVATLESKVKELQTQRP